MLTQRLQADLADEVLQWVADHCQPEDVFDEETLETWAKDNDYTKVTEDKEASE